jgi:hypothetical protein
MRDIGTDFNPVFAGLVLKNEIGVKEPLTSFVSMLQRGVIHSKTKSQKTIYCVGEYDPDSFLMSEKYILQKLEKMEDVGWGEIKEVLIDISLDKKYSSALEIDLENVGKKTKRSTKMGQVLNKLTMDSITKAGFIILFFGSLFLFFLLIILNAGDLYLCPFLLMIISLMLIPGFLRKEETGEFDKKIGVRQRREYLQIYDRIKDIEQEAYTLHDEDLAFAISFGIYNDLDKLLK